jgi:hypothetical protein
VFFNQVVQLHGVPTSIISNRYPVFTCTIWQELFRLSGTRLRLSSAFWPQTDGQSKVSNHIISMYLCCLAGDMSRSWLRWLPWAEYCFNTSFEVVYGRAPPPMIPFQARATHVAAVDCQLWDRDVRTQRQASVGGVHHRRMGLAPPQSSGCGICS